jgi:hypothetical protein
VSIHTPRFAAMLICVLVLVWFIPYVYGRATRADRFQLSGEYSPLTRRFMIWEMGPKGIRFRDEDGRLLPTREAQRLMPLVFPGNVRKWGGFPITLDGRVFSFEEAEKNLRYFSSLTPREIFGRKFPVHALFESVPEGVSLELPDDVLVVGADGISFLRCADGSLNGEKSVRFTAEIKRAGAVFPLRLAASNPSIYKPFDEGLVFIDGNGGIFQLQMARGEPVCRATGLVAPRDTLALIVEEHESRGFYAALAAGAGPYLLMYGDRLLRLPSESWDPRVNTLSLRSTALYRTMIEHDLSGVAAPVRYAALDRDFRPLRRYSALLPEAVRARSELLDKGLSLLTPFVLSQFFDLRFAPNPGFAALGVVCALGLFYACCRRARRLDLAALFLVACTGLPGCIAALAFGPLGRETGTRGT